MKTRSIFLILFFACQAIFAQTNTGISVQGIARDANKAALVDKQMTFIFDIQNASNGDSHYKEDVLITTDPYGVFSHIIGTGSVLSGNFNEIPFGNSHMKLVIQVDYEGTVVKISDSPFQYSPYAKSAENGVPTGTIVAFIGNEVDIPKGWTLCDGRPLSTVPGSGNLAALIGQNAPNLQGMFLRGTGTSPVNSQDGPGLRDTQVDGLGSHNHAASDGTNSLLNSDGGLHRHHVGILKHFRSFEGADGTDNPYQDEGSNSDGVYTNYEGDHTHVISGSTADTGIAETRPVNYGVNYIIKL